MLTFSSVSLFCEDIREEVLGQFSIIGVLPDNLKTEGPTPPTPTAIPVLPKLGIYMRINFITDGDQPKSVSAKVLDTAGKIITQSDWASSVIDKAFSDSKANQLPVVGLLLKIVMGPLAITRSGKITAIATVDGVDHVVGALNLIVPNASPQPAEQSPNAS